MRGVAINVGANTNEPGFRAPVDGDGQFDFVPIPEPEPTREDVHVPTYGELDEHLDLAVDVSDVADIPVHLDPAFDGYPFCEGYTYGDPYGAKAGPISELEAGDFLFFYATLDTPSEGRPDWQPPDWGAFLVGHFRLAQDPLGPEAYQEAGEAMRDVFANNAHVKRAEMDAAVLLHGDEGGLFERTVPLSSPTGGTDANQLVTDLSSDSGKGPWWRRPMRFDPEATATLREVIETRAFDEWLR